MSVTDSATPPQRRRERRLGQSAPTRPIRKTTQSKAGPEDVELLLDTGTKDAGGLAWRRHQNSRFRSIARCWRGSLRKNTPPSCASSAASGDETVSQYGAKHTASAGSAPDAPSMKSREREMALGQFSEKY